MSTLLAEGATSSELSSIGELITAIIGWIGDILSFVMAHPLLLLTVGIFVTGCVIGLVHRLIHG